MKGHQPDAWVSGLLGKLTKVRGVDTAPFRLGTEVLDIAGAK